MKSHWIAMELEQRGDPLGQNFRIFQQPVSFSLNIPLWHSASSLHVHRRVTLFFPAFLTMPSSSSRSLSLSPSLHSASYLSLKSPQLIFPAFQSFMSAGVGPRSL